MASLSPDSINWAIEHLHKYRDTDIFPKLFEFKAIYHCKDDASNWLSKSDICQWSPNPLRRCLVPKERHGFRIATQLDPMDMLFYLSLLLEVGAEIENARLPTSYQRTFSYHFQQDDSLYTPFNSNIGYHSFRERSKELATKYNYVVVTDIADFYPRIYLHHIENALSKALPNKRSHARAISQLIKGWNQNNSSGIPVGNNPSRLISELVIDPIDRILLAENIEFIRYVDDYHLFCHSSQHAYQCLSRLANILYESHRLTLQSQKTLILPSPVFIEDYLETESKREIDSLLSNFRSIKANLDISDPYDILDYDLLPSDLKLKVGSLNLTALLDEQVHSDEIDIRLIKFILKKLSWLQMIGEPSSIANLVSSIEKFYPVLPEVIEYLAQIKDQLTPETKTDIGEKLLNSISQSIIGSLEFNRMLIYSLFAGSRDWGQADKLIALYYQSTDTWAKRALLLANGVAGHDYCLRPKRTESESMPPWERRAFLYAASCLPEDERHNFYKALKSRLSKLELFITDWASKNPIHP